MDDRSTSQPQSLALLPLDRIGILLTICILCLATLSVGAISGQAQTIGSGVETEVEGIEFLKFGKPIESGPFSNSPGDLRRYQRAASRFPTFESCMSGNADLAAEKSLKIDWRLIRNLNELEVCIFRVAAENTKVEDITDWLIMSGFTVNSVGTESWQRMRNYSIDGEGVQILASLSRDQIPLAISGWIPFLRPHSLALAIITDSDGHPRDVSIGLVRK